MANKVIICGVDTSTLPRCNKETLNQLMEKIKQGDDSARNEFIFYNIRLVLSIVQRFSPNKDNTDDIFQVGIIGLIKSIDNFDINLGVRFSTYAVPMIIGEIRKYLRDSNSIKVTRSTRDIAYKAMQAKEKILRETSKDASIKDISEETGLSEFQIADAMNAISEPISLYETVFHDNGDSMLVMDQIKDTKNNDENWAENMTIDEALKRLNDKEKNIIIKRYFDGRTQMEVAEEIGISQAQVSRLEKNAIDSIKKQ
jgi:RNA polymerase sporulation-specific sigma factor